MICISLILIMSLGWTMWCSLRIQPNLVLIGHWAEWCPGDDTFIRSPTVLFGSIHWSISFLWSYLSLIHIGLRGLPKSSLILRIFLEFLLTLLLEPLTLCVVLDFVELLKDLVIVMKMTCGTREARAIEFMFCVPMFLILSRVVFYLSVLTIKNCENGTWKPKFPV